MVIAAQAGPALFTSEDYRVRMSRAVEQAVQAGLSGVIVTPGPDLVWLTGYRPTAITERITALILRPGLTPTLVVPVLERPDAEAAEGAQQCRMIDWADGSDPYAAVAPLLDPHGTFGISDSAWSLHLLGIERAVPGTSYQALSESLPMLRAVKDANELGRLELAAAAVDATYTRIVDVRFDGRPETEVAAALARLLQEFGHEQVDFTVVGSGPNGANPHHEAGDRVIQAGDAVVLDFGGLMHGYGSGTRPTPLRGRAAPQDQRGPRGGRRGPPA